MEENSWSVPRNEILLTKLCRELHPPPARTRAASGSRPSNPGTRCLIRQTTRSFVPRSHPPCFPSPPPSGPPSRAADLDPARFYFQITLGPQSPLEIAAISHANEPLCRQSRRVSTLYFNRLLRHSKRHRDQSPYDFPSVNASPGFSRGRERVVDDCWKLQLES